MTMTNILLVDDNEPFRQALKRNLEFMKFTVLEAENKDEALDFIGSSPIEAIITDLDMRFRTEGLQLIEDMRKLYPFIPVILISAVGTFEEGARAREMGAVQVISKSTLEENLNSLKQVLKESILQMKKIRIIWKKLREINRSQLSENELDFCKNVMKNSDYPQELKTLAFEILDSYQPYGESEFSDNYSQVFSELSESKIQALERSILDLIPDFKQLEDQTREVFRTAEFLWRNQKELLSGIDVSRSIGFAYSFAVENECKKRFRKNLDSFLKDRNTFRVAHQLYDPQLKNVALWFQRHLMFLQKQYKFLISLENVALVLRKLIERKQRFKPDGLKALGICLICFACDYKKGGKSSQVAIEKTLNIGGHKIVSDDMILELAGDLITLQHYRNPFIHPEITGEQKITKVREKSIMCLQKLAKL